MDKQEQTLREEFEQLQQQLEHPDVFGRTDYPKLAKRQSLNLRGLLIYLMKKTFFRGPVKRSKVACGR
jgi:hypothetical protein